jgi:hypothetical protein
MSEKYKINEVSLVPICLSLICKMKSIPFALYSLYFFLLVTVTSR